MSFTTTSSGFYLTDTEHSLFASETDSYTEPQMLALDDGNVLVSCTVTHADGTSDVVARVFTADWTPVSAEFTVNSYLAGNQSTPEMTLLENGNVVVTWTSEGEDGDGNGVYARILAPDGSAITEEIAVNSYTTGAQEQPLITTLAGGDFLVSWTSRGQDGSGGGVYAQRFNADGTADGPEFRINDVTLGIQENLALHPLADGGFALAWGQAYANNTWITAYADDGTVITSFQTDLTVVQMGSLSFNDFLPLADGSFLVAWHDRTNSRCISLTTYAIVQSYGADGTVGSARTILSVNGCNFSSYDPIRIGLLADGQPYLGAVEVEDITSDLVAKFILLNAAGESEGTALRFPLPHVFEAQPLGSDTLGLIWNTLAYIGTDPETLEPIPADTLPAIIAMSLGINALPAGDLTIEGGLHLDATLTLVDALTDADGIVAGSQSYQWYRNGVAIAGATGSTYLLGAADLGATISAMLTYLDGNGVTENASTTGEGYVLEYLAGTAGNDILTGTAAAEYIEGFAGNDVLRGGDGNDMILGGTGADTLLGEGGNDTLRGSTGDDWLLGGTGNDLLVGAGDADTLDGGDGNDTLIGGVGVDLLRGGLGADSLVGGDETDDESDTLIGGGGLNTLQGGGGNDLLQGGEDADLLQGGNGNDSLDGSLGDDTLEGGAGDDTLVAAGGVDSLSGGDGTDTAVFATTLANAIFSWSSGGLVVHTPQLAVTFGDQYSDTTLVASDIEWLRFTDGSVDLSGTLPVSDLSGADSLRGIDLADTLYGGDSDDVLYGAGGDDLLNGDAGADTLYCGAGNDQLFGGVGNDALEGQSGDDTIHGGDGDDVIAGDSYGTAEAGADELHGEAGNDLIFGFFGDDLIDGGDGNDTLNGGRGDDTVLGGAGADRLTGDAGADSFAGGVGNDTLFGGDDNDTLQGDDGADYLCGDDGDDLLVGGTSALDLADTLYGGDGNDTLRGGAGNDSLSGGLHNDVLLGEDGADTLIGGGGGDTLSGGAMSDLLYGGDGADFLNGGISFDRVNGGAGADQFYHAGLASHGTDWLQDYAAGEGDVLLFGISSARAANFLVNFATTPGAGDAGVAEAFVVYRPTGQIVWALVDGAAMDEIVVQVNVNGTELQFDLLA